MFVEAIWLAYFRRVAIDGVRSIEDGREKIEKPLVPDDRFAGDVKTGASKR